MQLIFIPRTIVLLRQFPYVIREWLLQWVARLTRNVEVVGSNPIKGIVSLSKKLYPNCLVLVGSMNGFERDFTIELK